MPTKEEALAELYRRGKLNENQRAAVEELARRGRVQLPAAEPEPRELARSAIRRETMAEIAEEIGPFEAVGIASRRAFQRLIGAAGVPTAPVGREEAEIEQALEAQRPIATGAGRVIGQTIPFVPAGIAAGAIPSTLARIAAATGVSAVEGGLIAEAEGGPAVPAAIMGGAIGLGAEVLFPVIGRLGRKIFQRVTGRAARGAMLDAAGRPTRELQDALDAADMSFEDLTQDAAETIAAQAPGAVPEQVARAARFQEAGVPATRGEITQEFAQRTTEARLLEAAGEPAAEPFRQFKLKQSEAVKGTLQKAFGFDVAREETGGLIQEALTGRRDLLRSQKNDLYRQASEAAGEIGGVPMFTDNIAAAMPDKKTLRRLSRIKGNQIEGLQDLLVEFGMSTDEGAVEAFMRTGGEVTPLSVENFEDFRQALGALERADITGSTKVASGPIKQALDTELNELGAILKEQGVSEDILRPFKAARKTVQQLKTEFSPLSTIGKIIDVKKDGVTQVTEASKVYNGLIGKAAPVEGVRKVVESLHAAGTKGQQALASIQAATVLDLISAGFGTESRKISGIKVFNPIAFKRRLDNIGRDKVKALFKGNADGFKKIQNIDNIISDLVPEAGAVPKGSAMVNLEIMKRLGMASIAAKIPGGALLTGAVESIAGPIKTGAAVRRAVEAAPEVEQLRGFIEQSLPGMASALGVAIMAGEQEETE